MTNREFNMIDSLFYYMWNAWSEEECSKVKWHHMASHFWDKWCRFSNKYGPYAAISPFIAELDDKNRKALYERANTLYEGKYRRKLTLEEALDCDIYSIHTINGIKHVKIQGYFYCAEGYEEEMRQYRLVEFCWAEIPLDEFLKEYRGNTDKIEAFVSECKQYICDLTQKEASESLANYFGTHVLDGKEETHAPTPLLYSQLTADTPCGDYIDLSF